MIRVNTRVNILYAQQSFNDTYSSRLADVNHCHTILLIYLYGSQKAG